MMQFLPTTARGRVQYVCTGVGIMYIEWVASGRSVSSRTTNNEIKVIVCLTRGNVSHCLFVFF